jgi:signal transduction histidine kinase
MRAFDRLLLVMIVLIAVCFTAVNLLMSQKNASSTREYRVQIERAASDIAEKGEGQLDLAIYPMLRKVEKYTEVSNGETGSIPDDEAFFTGADSEYALRRIDGVLYRFDYNEDAGVYSSTDYLMINLALAVMAMLLLGTLIYLRSRMLSPFRRLSEMPFELARGNLTLPLGENKNRFFGRFVWGMDLLRDKLESQKSEELKLRKDRKTLILSLSHDINTPLSAIRLYAKALAKNIYDQPEKNREIAESIDSKAAEIEGYVAEMIHASGEEFVTPDVRNGEFYLSVIMERIRTYYSDKLELLHTSFSVGEFTDCLLRGDADRAVEVLQNILENAIKYGDGREILIQISEEEDCRLIAVTNTGNTLPENELAHIFESFWRGSNAARREGSGLGLFICRTLMHRMDGEIFARIIGDEMTVTAVFRKA